MNPAHGTDTRRGPVLDHQFDGACVNGTPPESPHTGAPPSALAAVPDHAPDHAPDDTRDQARGQALLDALVDARVDHAVLRDRDAARADGTLTLLVARDDAPRADAALRALGLVATTAADGMGGRDYLGYDGDTGAWTRVVVTTDPSFGRGAGNRSWRPSLRHVRRWSLVVLRRALDVWRGLRGRRGLVVALVGPDGAGKTTLARALVREAPLRARRIYMGTNREAGNVLALGSWVARRRAVLGPRDRGVRRLALRTLGAVAHLAEQRYRHALALQHRARGGIVVFDRYAIDLDVNARLRRTSVTPLRRLRNWMLHAGALRPDLVLVLDAPGEVLYARKGEHSPDRLERMRRAYAALGSECPDVVVIDAAQDTGAVCRTVTALLWARCGARARAS